MSANVVLLSSVAWHFASHSLNLFSKFRSPAQPTQIGFRAFFGCLSVQPTHAIRSW